MKRKKEKKEIILEFIKEAYCVDGRVDFAKKGNYKVGLVIELNDSKRGRFYIAQVTEVK